MFNSISIALSLEKQLRSAKESIPHKTNHKYIGKTKQMRDTYLPLFHLNGTNPVCLLVLLIYFNLLKR